MQPSAGRRSPVRPPSSPMYRTKAADSISGTAPPNQSPSLFVDHTSTGTVHCSTSDRQNSIDRPHQIDNLQEAIVAPASIAPHYCDPLLDLPRSIMHPNTPINYSNSTRTESGLILKSGRTHSHSHMPDLSMALCQLVVCSLILFNIGSIDAASHLPKTTMSRVSFSCLLSVATIGGMFAIAVNARRLSLMLVVVLMIFATTNFVGVNALGSSQPSHSSHEVHSMPNENSHSQRTTDAELEMLKVLGYNEKPKPSHEMKVPQYMLDLYFWFRQTQLASARERERIRDDHEEKNPGEVVTLRSPLTALTNTDLDDLHRHQQHLLADLLTDEKEANMVKMIHQHHRLHPERQDAQPPRVALTGPVNSVASHKLKDHDNESVDRRAIPIRRKKRDVSVDQIEEQLLMKPASNEAHLTFELKVPDGDFLKGGELRLFRHAVRDDESEMNRNDTDNGDSAKQTTVAVVSEKLQSTRKNKVYLPLHWSLRWSLEKQDESNSTSNNHQLIEPSVSSTTPTVTPPLLGSTDQFLQRVTIYHLLRPISELHIIRAQNSNDSVRVNMGRMMRMIDTQVIDVRQSGWLSFDIYPAAKVWVAHPEQNYGLLVAFTDIDAKPSQHGRLVVVNQKEAPTPASVQSIKQNLSGLAQDEANSAKSAAAGTREEWNKLQPHVVTFSLNEEHSGQHADQFGKADYDSNRLRREWNDNSNGGRQSSKSRTIRRRKKQRRACMRQPLFFDFNSVGWNEFVVAPPGFQTYFCAGECNWPLTNYHNFTNHATIQGILNTHNPATIPAPCCVPTDLSPYTLLTVDTNGGIHLRTFTDMVVEGCGCR